MAWCPVAPSHYLTDVDSSLSVSSGDTFLREVQQEIFMLAILDMSLKKYFLSLQLQFSRVKELSECSGLKSSCIGSIHLYTSYVQWVCVKTVLWMLMSWYISARALAATVLSGNR